MDRTDDYDYHLPPELIAARPLPARDAARLLVVDRADGSLRHANVRDLPDLLRPHDALVVNETRVLPARLLGTRAATGGRWEGLFLGTGPDGNWRLLSKTRGRIRPGERVRLDRLGPTAPDAPHEPPLELTLLARETDDGVWSAAPDRNEPPEILLERFGTLPLPPYVKRATADAEDRERYQTTFARRPGAVAAPTAGLHFTPELLERCRARGVSVAPVVLHVGLGTFRPIAVERLADHAMHTEWCELSESTAESLRAARAAGGRIAAVGTTSVRTLESARAATGDLVGWSGETNLFLRPPHAFRAVDVLLTNFHLPRSTLLVLVSAFAGCDLIRAAYAEAIAARYRFYSYGDAMLIV
jgi:S-adenosylmethionine:tRNA ribosyltransferase-isomerase